MSDELDELEAIGKLLVDLADEMREACGDMPFRVIGDHLTSLSNMAADVCSEVRRLRRIAALSPVSPPVDLDLDSHSLGNQDGLGGPVPSSPERAEEGWLEGPPLDAASRAILRALDQREPSIPEGFIPWSGGEWDDYKYATVEVLLRGGHRFIDEANVFENWNWKSFADAPDASDIIAYRRITDDISGKSRSEAEGTTPPSDGEAVNEQSIIDATDLPSISTDDVERFALETFWSEDGKHRFAKKDGQTYIVTREPEMCGS